MTFRVEITRRAAREIENQFHWLAERSPAAAERLRDRLLAAIGSLEENPEPCPESPEAEWYGPGLRQLLHGKRRGVYRIFFEIRGDVVIVLRVHHSAQDHLAPKIFERWAAPRHLDWVTALELTNSPLKSALLNSDLLRLGRHAERPLRGLVWS
jgi:plasmid stabilization system protein ParE